MSVEDQLKKVPYLNQLEDEQIKELLGIGTRESWEANRTVFAEGDQPDNLYVILTGKVKICRKTDEGTEVELATLEKGEFFGELALLDAAPRSATVSTIDPSEFFVIGREEFIGLLTRYPRIIPGLLASLSGKIRRINEKFFLEVLEKQALLVEMERERFRSLTQFAAAAHEAISVEKALQAAIDRICSYTGWPAGHVYFVDEDTQEDLFSSSVWRLKIPEQFESFRQVSEMTRFGSGIDLPGKVLASGKPFWVEDLTQVRNSPRAKAAAEAGIKGSFAFPVLVGKEVAAVLEFFSDRPGKPDELLFEAICSIGAQLGQVIERKRWEEQLVHNAFHDAVTDLPNRTLFLDRLGLCVARAKRSKEYLFAVMYIDLDRFKVVNDSMGHAMGDRLLVEIGRKLQACVRDSDTVARLGGDEFGILLDDIRQMSDVPRTVERIRKEMLSPFHLDGREVFTSVSIGIALSSTGYERGEDLLRDADTAMYRAKAQGRGRHEVFDPSMHEQAVRLLSLESGLRQALQRRELRFHFQPIVSLATRKVTGFEALIRWLHPERGLLSPAEFIPLAEETELIVPITAFVLQEACRQLRIWRTQFPANVPLSVSVNLTARYLAKPDLLEEIAAVLSENGLAPRNLGLEITESQIMENLDFISKGLLDLSDLGVKLYIDDFGTGYSSLSYLSSLPIHVLKIDRSFVSNLHKDEKNASLVRSIVALGHNLGIDVVAEGIETAEQLDFLRALKCHYGQGYYFSGPMDTKAVAELLAEYFRTSGEKKVEIFRLRAFQLFEGLNDLELGEIAESCEELEVQAGTVLIRQGQVGNEIYLMEEGSVSVYRGEADARQFLAALQAPVVFGEMAIVNPERIRTASVIALSNLRLLTIPATPLLSFLRRFPALKDQLRQMIAERSSGRPVKPA